jgi:predicted nucleotidyltransferase
MDTLVPRALDAVMASEPVRARQVIACWAFGSRVTGTATPASDVDLAVLCDPPLGLERTRVMDAAGREAGLDVDVIDMGSAPPALRWEIITTGKLVVERDEPALEEFVRRSRWDSEDDEQRNRMILLAQVPEVALP